MNNKSNFYPLVFILLCVIVFDVSIRAKCEQLNRQSDKFKLEYAKNITAQNKIFQDSLVNLVNEEYNVSERVLNIVKTKKNQKKHGKSSN